MSQETTTTTPPPEGPPQNTVGPVEELAKTLEAMHFATLAESMVILRRAPDNGKLAAYRLSATPIEHIEPSDFVSESFELITQVAHKRVMIEGKTNRIHHSLWRQGGTLQSLYLMDYAPWNMILYPFFADGEIKLHNTWPSLRENISEGTAWYNAHSANWRCLIEAAAFKVDCVGVMLVNTDNREKEFGERGSGDSKPVYRLFLAKIKGCKIPSIYYLPSNNCYSNTNICAPVISGKLGYGPNPDGIFQDFENSPGNRDLNHSGTLCGTVELSEDSFPESYIPYVSLSPTAPLRSVSVTLPPVWEISSFRKLFRINDDT
jgi:hypothetical protein